MLLTHDLWWTAISAAAGLLLVGDHEASNHFCQFYLKRDFTIKFFYTLLQPHLLDMVAAWPHSVLWDMLAGAKISHALLFFFCHATTQSLCDQDNVNGAVQQLLPGFDRWLKRVKVMPQPPGLAAKLFTHPTPHCFQTSHYIDILIERCRSVCMCGGQHCFPNWDQYLHIRACSLGWRAIG